MCRNFATFLLLTLLFGFSLIAQETNMSVPLIPMQDFFKNPEKTSFTLSPDGKQLAFLQPWENRLNIHVQQIGSDEVIRVSSSTERDIFGFFWGNNEKLVYIQDKGGDENYRIYATSADGKDERDLTPFDGVRAMILDDLRDNDDEMLIMLNQRNPVVFDVYRLNINTGEMALVAENPGNVTSWDTDHNGVVRIATATDGVNTTLLYRKNEGEDFKPVITTNFRETLSPQFFTFDNEYIYAASNIGRDKLALVKYDLDNNKELEVIFEHPEVDISNAMSSRKRKVLTGVSYFTDKRGYHFFDETRKAIQEELEKKLPGYEVAVGGMNRNEDKVLVRTYSDKSRGAYYFYDMNTKDFFKLAEISPWLDESHMADMKPVVYKSRDGLTIHGYLTLPNGVEPKNLPVVVNPHGGPWARDYWGFNPEIQFLANRGYAVLQMNFRGSTGYGKAFWEASFKQWGRAMQDDVTDGVNWLIEQGVADPERVGIYGGSYGGYTTLAGLAFTPDLYACGVDYVGVSNLLTFMASIPPYWKPYLEMLYEMVGHPEEEKDMMIAASPVFHVDKIKAPLLIAQGANDPRVVKAESDQMVEALKAKGIDVPYIVKDNEGHGFANEENRFDFYRAMEEFLGKHIGGRVE